LEKLLAGEGKLLEAESLTMLDELPVNALLESRSMFAGEPLQLKVAVLANVPLFKSNDPPDKLAMEVLLNALLSSLKVPPWLLKVLWLLKVELFRMKSPAV